MKLSDLFEKKAISKVGTIPVVQQHPDADMKYPATIDVGEAGAQGHAVQHPKERSAVVKYASIQQPYEQDPYVQFINMCQYHQDNPFLPRVKSAKIIEHEEYRGVVQGRLIVVMEKLYHLSEGDDHGLVIHPLKPNMDFFNKAFDGLDVGDHQISLIRKGAPLRSNWHQKTNISLDAIGTWFFEEGGFDSLLSSGEIRYAFDNKQFLEAVELLRPLVRIYDSDLHIQNVMVRGSHQLVILDPLYIMQMHSRFEGKQPGYR